MAGGKETPRQKMIGMMYLVLTALLALQVSNAVLEKFAIINGTLSQLVVETNKENAGQLQAIISKGGKSTVSKIKNAVEKSQQVRELSANTVQYIEDLKKTMMKESGATEINEALINDHSSKVATLMIDPNSPVGKEFEDRLNDYVKQLNQLTGESFGTLAKAPKDIDVFAGDEDHARKSFLEFTFENTPVIAALTSVTQIQTEILEYESSALRKFAEEVGAAQVSFESIIPMVRPVSSVVAAGAPYEADMFISASSSTLSPEMFYNGKPIEVVLDPVTGIKMGKVKFNATASGYDKDGMSKQSFKAEIKLNDSTYVQTMEYMVAKPVIRVTTGNAPTLYMGCGNFVNIEVPTLGTNYKPSFSAKGAQVIQSGQPGKVTIVPNQRKVTVGVSNAGVFIGNEVFDVRNVPRPRIVAKDNNGRDIDLKDGIKAGSISGLRVVAEAEENFKIEVPKDANYRIRNLSIILARGTTRVQELTLTSEIVDLTRWRSLMRPGDRIVIEPRTVVRMTFQGGTDKVTTTPQDIVQFPVH